MILVVVATTFLIADTLPATAQAPSLGQLVYVSGGEAVIVNYKVSPGRAKAGERVVIEGTNTYEQEQEVCGQLSTGIGDTPGNGARFYRGDRPQPTNTHSPALAGFEFSTSQQVSRTAQQVGPCREKVVLIDVIQGRLPSAEELRSVEISDGPLWVYPIGVSFEREGQDDPLHDFAGYLPRLTITGIRERRTACEKYENKGAARTPLSTIRLYKQFHNTICQEGNRFDISPLLIAVTIQHEGYNRSKLVQSDWDRELEFRALPNETVGVGQMYPHVALRLARKYFDRYEQLTESQVRRKLCFDSEFATQMVAAYLFELKSEHGLTDKEAFITYGFGADDLPELRRTRFKGKMASKRREVYDSLVERIGTIDGY